MEHIEEFLQAVKQGQIEQVTALLAQEPGLLTTCDENGTSAVLLATYYGQPNIVALLRQQGVTLDIFEAATLGDLARVQGLVEADPTLVNAYAPDGFYPLGLACFFGNTAVAEYLLNTGADVNQAARNPQLVQPIHAASAHGSLVLVELLVEHGADVNAKQANDFTPLHSAAQTGILAMAVFLLEQGANVNATSKDGKTPLDFAIDAKHISHVLMSYGGRKSGDIDQNT